MQKDQVGQGSSKRSRTYVKCQKDETSMFQICKFVTQKEVAQKIQLSPGLMPRVNRNQRIQMMILQAYLFKMF